jgi:hypothetical protein
MKIKYFLVFGLIAFGLLFWAPFGAQASVETGWPVGKANICKNAGDGFIDFEKGIEEVQIESSIPGLQFTTTGGINWRYGDIRTGKYNSSNDGTKNYVNNGNFFAWSGVSGDTGRIDFTGGNATYLSLLASTHSGLQLDAYDAADNLIATSGQAANNSGTGTFTRLTVEAPAGKTMAYVLVHDSGNYWLADDICTDAAQVCKPLPGRSEGDHSDKIDLIFVPDEDYGAAADIGTWMPGFLSDAGAHIDNLLGGKDPVTGNLDKFNFYYTQKQGTASTDHCGNASLPNNLLQDCTYADAVVVLHKNEFGDCANANLYTAEGPVFPKKSFIHETGHAVFGLADEYDDSRCVSEPKKATNYSQPNPMPNIWRSEANCVEDASSTVGWDPADCYKFTECKGGWWKLGTTEYIMEDGPHFDNGWGVAASRRISWVLEQYQSAASSAATDGKSISLDLNFFNGAVNLTKKYFITDDAPNYLPGQYAFETNVYSTGGALLGTYGFADPRVVLAESDYNGPTNLDNVNFTVTVPYFSNIGRADIVDNSNGAVLESVDLSEYAGNQTPPSVDTTPPVVDSQISGTAGANDWFTSDIVVNWSVSDPESGIASSFGCEILNMNAETNGTTITCTATNGVGLSASKTITVKIDKTAPSLVWNGGPANNSEYYFDTVPAAPTCTASDALSGPDTCDISGYSAEVGSRVLTATARDKAGNQHQETRTYKVMAWNLKGFSGLQSGGTYNYAMPLMPLSLAFKIFSGTKEVTKLAAVKSMTYTPINCATKKSIGGEVAMAAYPGTSLKYYPIMGFVFNWMTPAKGIFTILPKCYRGVMTAADGSSLVAYFKIL